MGLRQPGRRRQISIHAPREGCDLRDNAAKLTQAQFQSTHPVRGATHRIRVGFLVLGISIHAPREGCDSPSPPRPKARTNFNPRTP